MTDTRRRRWLVLACYVALSLVLLALYASWGRPIWYDESVYYVLGGFDSLPQVLSMVRETTTNVNQGVTGAYMISVFLVVKALGASSIVLRLPSLLFGAYMLMACFVFMRVRRIPVVGVLVLPVVLAGQATLMYYAGEARTYMPLAASVAGLLAYYAIPVDARARWSVRLLGWSAVLIGVLFHPYVALYWPAVIVVLYGTALAEGTERFGWRGLARYANPALIVVGGLLYTAIAALTWARGTAPSSLNPYTFLVDPLWKSIVAQLFQFVYVHRELEVIAAVITLTLMVLAFLGRPSTREFWLSVLPPVALMAVAFVLAYAVSLLSISQTFWIIPRQWIGSMVMVPLGAIWLVSALARFAKPRFEPATVVLVSSLAFVALWLAMAPVLQQVRNYQQWQERPVSTVTRAQLAQRLASGDKLSEDEWVAFAQANLDAGGPVWPEFRRYYTDTDWSTFRLDDGSAVRPQS